MVINLYIWSSVFNFNMHDAGVSLNKQSRPFIFSTLWNVKAASRHVATSQENKYKTIHNIYIVENFMINIARSKYDNKIKCRK